MFRSSLTIIRPVCESCLTNAGYILGSHYVYTYASAYTCYINTLKSGEGIVNGTIIICGNWVCSWGRRTASLLVFLVFLLTCSLKDYGRSVSSGVIFYVGPVGGSGFVFLIIPTAYINIVGSHYVASICKTRFTNGPDDGQWRPKHVAPQNIK